MMSYEIFMQGLTNHPPPPKELQRKKLHLIKAFFKPQGSNTRYFIRRINNIVEYLNNVSLFSMDQGFLDNKITNLNRFEFP